MRRIAYAALMLMGVLTIAGCARGDELFNGKTEKITFVASFADETRTSYQGEGKVDWVEGDSIWYYTKKGGTIGEYEVVRSGHSTNVVADVTSGTSYIIAAYGGTGITDNTVTSFTLNGAVTATQTGKFEDAHVSVAKGFDIEDGASITFHNMTSVISFSLDRTDVSYITFTANGGEKIHGDGAMKITFKDDQPSVAFGDGGGSSIRVNTSGAGTFYIATLPVELAKGFEIDYFDAAANNIAHTVYDKTFVIGNDELVNLGTLDGRMVSYSEFEYVDLGLSVKWANCNLCASAPEQYGSYYLWGGLQDVTSTSIRISWSNWPFHTGTSSSTGWTKYVPSNKSSCWSGSGNPDNKTVLDPDDDVAHVKLGGKWRMPTIEEWRELNNNCTSEWTTRNGVEGMKFTSKKNGNSIFLPASGYRINSELYYAGSGGYYWSSSLDPYDPYFAYYFDFNSGGVYTNVGSRYYGQSVRPVYDDASPVVTSKTCTLADGPTFNVLLKELTDPINEFRKESIITDTVTKIVFSPRNPSTAGVIVSDNTSGCPAFASYDPVTDVITITSTAEQFALGRDASHMFHGFRKCKEIVGLTELSTENCENMGYLFAYCSAIKKFDLSNFKTENVYAMNNMFWYCQAATEINVSSFNTENVANMHSMFCHCDAVEHLNLTHFDTAGVTDFGYMFGYCYALLDVDISSFDTSGGTTFAYMFAYCKAILELDLATLDTSSSTTLTHMFDNMSNIGVLKLGENFNVNHAPTMSYMFIHCPMLHDLWLAEGFKPDNGTKPSNFFAYTGTDDFDSNGNCIRTASAMGALAIHCNQDQANWLATTSLRWLHTGYKEENGYFPSTVTFLDFTTGQELSVTWSPN